MSHEPNTKQGFDPLPGGLSRKTGPRGLGLAVRVLVVSMLLPVLVEGIFRLEDDGSRTYFPNLLSPDAANPAGYGTRPNNRLLTAFWHSPVRVETDSHGLRVTAEKTENRSPAQSVLLLGDDDVFAPHLPVNETLAGQWEAQDPWRRLHVMNAGVPGYRLADMTTRGLGLVPALAPDRVVLVLRDVDETVSSVPSRPVFGTLMPQPVADLLPGSAELHARLLSVSSAYNRLVHVLLKVRRAWQAPVVDDSVVARHELLARRLTDFSDALQALPVAKPPRLAVLLLPNAQALRRRDGDTETERRLHALLTAQGIQALRTGPFLRAAHADGPLLDDLDRLTPLAYRRLVELLADAFPVEPPPDEQPLGVECIGKTCGKGGAR